MMKRYGMATATDDLQSKLRMEQRKLAIVQAVSRALSSDLDLDGLLKFIMDKATELMDADRSTLFLLSDDGNQLWSKVVQGDLVKEIRLNVGEGIAGWVAQSGETVNIPDAYSDARFTPRVDHESGYRTRSILCMPMRDTTGKTTGVLQLLNKRDGTPFTHEDEELLAALASQVAVSLQNSKLFHSIVAKNVELVVTQRELERKSADLRVLYEIERDLSETTNLDEFLERLMERTLEVLSAEAGSIVLVEGEAKQLRFRTVTGPAAERLRQGMLPWGEGLIGWVVERGEPALVNDPAADARHAAAFAEQVGVRPRNIICAPLVAGGEVLGAIEVIDKRPAKNSRSRTDLRFSEDDLQLLGLIAAQAAHAIQVSAGRVQRDRDNRLATIGQMLASVIHDLKTPMTIISGYAQLMAQIEDKSQREDFVKQIQRQFELMSGMTREVMAFARGESHVLIRKVFLHRFLETVKTQLEHAFAKKQTRLVFHNFYDGVAYFDENSMLRVIHNLAQNAADAMDNQGLFEMTTRLDGTTVVFEFRDEGPGIPEELRGRLFDPFATSGKAHGTGLGLAIAKKIVTEHGGSIDVESARGKGTKFIIRLGKEKPAHAADSIETEWPEKDA